MIGSFSFKGIESNVYNLVCKSVKRPLLPTMRTKMTEVYGKNGLIDYGGNIYNTRQITMHITYIGNSYTELRSRAREIATWLNTTKWEKLIINDELDKYYLARVINEIDLETLGRLGETDITFECQPFAYSIRDSDYELTWNEVDKTWNETEMTWNLGNEYAFYVTDNTTFSFDNIGTKEINYSSPQGSKSNIIITGSWITLSITLNGKTLTYTGAETGELIIDNVNMEITLDNINKLDMIDGDIDSFFTIISGQNTITINGTGLNVAVQLAFTPMYL